MDARRRTTETLPTAGARTESMTVMADDGALYVLPLGERIVLDVLAYEDEGLLAFIRIDGEVVAELPVREVKGPDLRAIAVRGNVATELDWRGRPAAVAVSAQGQ